MHPRGPGPVLGPIATSRPSRAGNLISWSPLSLGDGIVTVVTVEPALLLIRGDLHNARLAYVAGINHWTLAINKRGKLVEISQRRFKGATADSKFFPDCQEKWRPHWPNSRTMAALAYPDTTPSDHGAIVMCVPVQRRRRSKTLQPEETRDAEKISGLMLMPHPDPGGLQGVYEKIGMFVSMPNPHLEQEKTTLGFREGYCYSGDNKRLFSHGPMGSTEMVLLN